MNPLRVAVIGGGTSCEHDVSLSSAAAACAALVAAGHDVVPLTIDRDGMWRNGASAIGLSGAVEVLRDCQVAVPMLHGPGGEDGTLAALCDLADVPYVGSTLGASAIAMDKWATKLVAEAIGVPTAPGRLVTRADAGAVEFTHPVVVKPVAAGSSHGVSMVRDAAGLRVALEAAFAVGDRVLVEDVVVGREIDLAVFGRSDGSRTVPPALEIVVPPESGIFDLDSKYDGSAVFHVPAPVSDADRDALERAAVAVYDALGCAGVARVDFFLTEQGPVLNEINTIPGFTEHSQVPRMFAAAGTSYPELLDAMVREATSDRAPASY